MALMHWTDVTSYNVNMVYQCSTWLRCTGTINRLGIAAHVSW